MTIETARFGAIEYDDSLAIHFPEGIPGIENMRRYILVHIEETEPIFWLQSLEDPALAFPVAHAFELMEEFALDVDDDDLALLKIEHPQDVLVLVIVVIPEQMQRMTANFAAPLIIHTKEGLGKQVFAAGAAYSVRHPIFEAVMAALERREADAGAVPQGE